MAKRKIVKKKVVRKSIAKGIVYISATFNNTMVTVTDEMGNAIAWSSAGGLGFKGSKKSTPYAAQQAVEDALNKAKEHGIKEVGIKVQGPGSGRELQEVNQLMKQFEQMSKMMKMMQGGGGRKMMQMMQNIR